MINKSKSIVIAAVMRSRSHRRRSPSPESIRVVRFRTIMMPRASKFGDHGPRQRLQRQPTICTIMPRTPLATRSAIRKSSVSVEATKKMGAGYGSPPFPLPALKSRRRDRITNGWLEHVGVAIA
jgi:hypothetical protein